MEWTREEELWIILSHLLESDDILYSNEYIADLLIKADFTDFKHIRKVFGDVLASFVFHTIYGYNVWFEPEEVVSMYHFCKKNLLFRFIGLPIQKLIAYFFAPNKEFQQRLDAIYTIMHEMMACPGHTDEKFHQEDM